MTMDLTELQRQLDALTQQEHQDESTLRSVAADLTRQAYMIEAVHQLLDIIEPRKMHLAERIASIVPRHPSVAQRQTPPPIPTHGSDVGGFVSRVAGHVSQMGDAMRHPLDPFEDVSTAPIDDWLRSRRNVAAE